MNLKTIVFCILASFFAFFACDDDLDTIGTGIQPDPDKVNVYADTIPFEIETVKLDSIYAKTINGMLGEYYDPTFGNLKAGFICQFYAPEDPFPYSPIDDKIDSVILNIYYAKNNWVGDSLAPMEVSVFPITSPLDKHYYTNINPVDYCDMSTTWGKQAYTAYNLNIPDSIRNSSYIPVSIKLPTEFGIKLFEESKKPQPNIFSSLEAFTDFFKGLYITTTYGSGNIIQVYSTSIRIFYNSVGTEKDVNGNDSSYVALTASTLSVTKEVIQLNKYESSFDSQLLTPNSEKSYVKSPAGICTKITIPIPEIAKRIGDHQLNNVKLSLTGSNENFWDPFPKYSQQGTLIPKTMLLINRDSMKTFFENQLPPNKVTSYATSYSSSICDFGNIGGVIQNAIKYNKDNQVEKNLELLVMPVEISTYTDSYNQTYQYATTNYLSPLGITFKKDPKFLKLYITSSDMTVNQ